MMTDPIADMLTQIRNANSIYMKKVSLPYSKIKEGIAKKLAQEGFIKSYEVVEGTPCNRINIYLKYGNDGEKVIRVIKRVSKPSCRVYRRVKDVKKVLNGLGTSLLSTSHGILTDKECREKKVGGELLCVVW